MAEINNLQKLADVLASNALDERNFDTATICYSQLYKYYKENTNEVNITNQYLLKQLLCCALFKIIKTIDDEDDVVKLNFSFKKFIEQNEGTFFKNAQDSIFKDTTEAELLIGIMKFATTRDFKEFNALMEKYNPEDVVLVRILSNIKREVRKLDQMLKERKIELSEELNILNTFVKE